MYVYYCILLAIPDLFTIELPTRREAFLWHLQGKRTTYSLYFFLEMMQRLHFVMPACIVIYEPELLVLALLPADAYNEDVVSSGKLLNLELPAA